jgi:SAM-dependent methyltransferase
MRISDWKDYNGLVHSGETFHEVNDFKVISCNSCGFAHVIPIPTEHELTNVYKHDYYLKEKPFYLERYLEDKEWWINTYSIRYELFEKFLPQTKRTILDIGSGPGLFLLAGKERGWNVKGVEPSAQASKFSREELGLDVEEFLLDSDSAKKIGRYDVVNLSLVLEHIPDPKSMVRLAYSLLSDGGLLSISVPNEYNPFQQILNKSLGFQPWWVAPPHHINYFNSQTLEGLVSGEGFFTLHKGVTFPLDIFLLMGKNYVGNDLVGRECHGFRKNFENNLMNTGNKDLLNKLYQSFSEVGIGREIILIAKKKVEG